MPTVFMGHPPTLRFGVAGSNARHAEAFGEGGRAAPSLRYGTPGDDGFF
jgi:hypothetical protein